MARIWRSSFECLKRRFLDHRVSKSFRCSMPSSRSRNSSRHGAPMTLVRGGEDRDVAAIAAMGRARAARFRFHLDRDVDLVRYTLTRTRLFAGLRSAGSAQLIFVIAEEGITAAAYVVISVSAGTWTIEECGDRDASGARVGALLQALIAREPVESRPVIRGWLPPGFVPPQVTISSLEPAGQVLLARVLSARVPRLTLSSADVAVLAQRHVLTRGAMKYAGYWGRARPVVGILRARTCLRVPRYHVGPLLLFAGLSLLWTFPLALHMGTHVPGDPGDNYSILWNLWWARRVLTSSDLSFFHTASFVRTVRRRPRQSPPHSPPRFLCRDGAGTCRARRRTESGHPAVSLCQLCLCLLADLRHRAPSTRRDAGAAIFGASPYVSAHLLGHFDLISAWVLPLFGLCLRRALATGGTRWMIACGVALALAAYSADHYVVYLGLMAGAYVIGHLSLAHFRLEARLQTTRTRTFRWAGASLLLLDAALIVWISATDGGTWTILGRPVSIHSVQNPLTLGWVLLGVPAHHVASAASPTGPGTPTLMGRRPHSGLVGADLRRLRITAPLPGCGPGRSWALRDAVVRVAECHARNKRRRAISRQFVSSATAHCGGILVAMVQSRRRRARGGVVPHLPLRRPRRGRSVPSPDARPWHAVLFIAFVWALGPRLVVAGFDAGLPLPQILARFIPLVNNARVPGRAMVLLWIWRSRTGSHSPGTAGRNLASSRHTVGPARAGAVGFPARADAADATHSTRGVRDARASLRRGGGV